LIPHIRSTHGLTAAEYEERYPSAPIFPPDLLQKMAHASEAMMQGSLSVRLRALIGDAVASLDLWERQEILAMAIVLMDGGEASELLIELFRSQVLDRYPHVREQVSAVLSGAQRMPRASQPQGG